MSDQQYSASNWKAAFWIILMLWILSASVVGVMYVRQQNKLHQANDDAAQMRASYMQLNNAYEAVKQSVTCTSIGPYYANSTTCGPKNNSY